LALSWAGVRYQMSPNVDGALVYYGFSQNNYGNAIQGGCSSRIVATCSGTLDAISLQADYHLTARLDTYAGALYTAVHDGLASGYLHSTDLNPTIGLRYIF
jgi:predicted porin